MKTVDWTKEELESAYRSAQKELSLAGKNVREASEKLDDAQSLLKNAHDQLESVIYAQSLAKANVRVIQATLDKLHLENASPKRKFVTASSSPGTYNTNYHSP